MAYDFSNHSVENHKFLALKEIVSTKQLNDTHPVVLAMDFTKFRRNLKELKAAFPPNFLHAFAAKAGALRFILEEIQKEGLGIETASPTEFEQALRCGFSTDKIVFDSPAKTYTELEKALEKGVTVNVDNLQELARVAKIIEEKKIPSARVGMRLNPQVGAGKIQAMSTATKSSKFGVPLEDDGSEAAVLAVYAKYPWLNGVHLHVGSQGCPLDLIAAGISRVLVLVDKVNAARGSQQITSIDIGGGLPVNFDSEVVTPTFADYAAFLKERCPKLFTGEFQVITEFGRTILAKTGFIAAQVEYAKVSGERHIAIVQTGADLFVRTVYMPDKWAVRITACDPSGNPKPIQSDADLIPQDIAGPCCFAGDIIAHLRPLPLLQSGDIVMAHDVGAYHFSGYSLYNSRLLPPIFVYEYQEDEGKEIEKIEMRLARPGKSLEETISFFYG